MNLEAGVKRTRPYLFKRCVVETPSVFLGSKGRERLAIHRDIFDLYDSVADNAKLVTLLFKLFEALYTALPESVKDAIPKESKGLIEHVINERRRGKLRIDAQYELEGVDVINRLFERQRRVQSILEHRRR